MLQRRTQQRMMRTFRVLPRRVTRYFAKGILRIFSPNQDQYPAIGVQPFTGEAADKTEYR